MQGYYNSDVLIIAEDFCMIKLRVVLLLVMVVSGCKRVTNHQDFDFVLTFGSCNKQYLQNTLWTEIEKLNPDVWVWGGDTVYSDTQDMQLMQKNYQILKSSPDYARFIQTTDVMGTWDDHDYGANDSGVEYPMKKESQQLFLDFLDVPENDVRRQREGVYTTKDYQIGNHSIKIIVLDTRYFRSPLTPSETSEKRYQPNSYGEGSMLGETQWKWLAEQLSQSDSDFNVIVSSIQFLSDKHGFEKWANMPHEVDKMKEVIAESGARNVIILSGDRHISELSVENVEELKYPLIDFTSSGMTHSFGKPKQEENRYRSGPLVTAKTFGALYFDFEKKQVLMKLIGEGGQVFLSRLQQY